MRILHTSDWHLGKTLEGRSRLLEQQAFIDELCKIADDQLIDLVLIAGDIFDTVNPPAAAEELYYDALDRLALGGKRAVVVIAGNHDSPERLCAAAPLAQRYGIVLSGYPKDILVPNQFSGNKSAIISSGLGFIELRVPNFYYNAVIGILPYPSEARLDEIISAELTEEDLQAGYSSRVRNYFQSIKGNFRKDTVNLAVSHLFVRGGIESDSERPIQLGGAPTVEPDAMPEDAHYVALGHLHRPQNVKGTTTIVRYAGSPLAYSFSEVGYAKSVTIIDATPGLPAVVQEIFLSSGYPLVKWQAKEGLAQVFKWIEEGKDLNAWIDLDVYVSTPITQQEIVQLRRQRERIVNIRPIFPELQEQAFEKRDQLPVNELFKRFFSRQNGGAEPTDELVSLFLELIDATQTNSGEENA